MKIWREGIINWNHFSFKKTPHISKWAVHTTSVQETAQSPGQIMKTISDIGQETKHTEIKILHIGISPQIKYSVGYC